jgi:hypothetical protein
MVIVLKLELIFAGSNSDEDEEFLRAIKISVAGLPSDRK